MAKVITTELQHSGASGANITLDSSKNVTCENNLTVDGTTTLTGAVTLPAGTTQDTLSFRNLVINGSMQIQQYPSTALTANGTILDRFKHDGSLVGFSITRSTIAANAGGPADEGHRYAWKAANTSTTTHNDRYLRIQHMIEAQNLACSGWKYNDTNDNIVVSFWMKTSLAGTYQFSLRTLDGSSQSFIHETPSISANTWTKVTKVIPGHANITVDNDNGVGLEFNMWITVGPSFTTSDRTQNAWVAFDGGGQAKDENVNWGNSGSATFEFTGLQIEVGDAATEFEHRSFGDELARCQRYYFMESGDDGDWMCTSITQDSSDMYFFINFPVPMRTNPSYTAEDVNVRHYGANASDAFGAHGLAVSNQNTTATSGGGCTNTVLYKSGASITAGQAGVMQCQADGVKLQFSAEL